MESRDCKWLNTRDDGILLFKNIAFNIKESDKKDEDGDDYEIISNFSNPDNKFQVSQRYFHSDMLVFCTISERINGEDDKLKEIKVRLESMDSEAIIPATEKELEILKDSLDMNIRVIQKTGTKMTIQGKYSLFENMKGNIATILKTAGLNESTYKIFHKDSLLDKNTDIDKIYEPGKDIYLVAFESLGKPKRWNRFPRIDSSSWSNSGSCSDGIVYIPSKNVTIAGFVSYGARDDPEYELKYELKINGVLVEENPPTKYEGWEDTHYKTIMFKDLHDVSASGKIQITIWMSKSFSSNSCVYTHYGTSGYDYGDVQNEDMGLFTFESAESSSNGTSVSSGQIPAILYYLD